MAKLKTAILFSVGEKYLIFVIQFVSSIAIARLLSPHEIGIFSIGSLVLSFSHALRDLGISNYLIQERELTPERLRTAGTITLTMSWFLACVAWLASEPLAAFYREDGVGEVLNVLALNFLILPLGSVSGALLRRNMQFDKLIRINLAASLTQSLLGIALCYHGVGFIGLAWAAVAATAVTVALTLLIGGRAASLRPALGEWRHVMSTGGRFSASAMLNELGLAAPEIIVGKAGSGMHIHMRIMKDGRNMMLTPERTLSVEARKAIAGMMDLAQSITAFGNKNPMSWLRLVPHQEAPTNICWGMSNRSVLVRVPLGWTSGRDMCMEANPNEPHVERDYTSKQTVEMRSPDGSADIFQLLAGLCVACRHGFEHGPREHEGVGQIDVRRRDLQHLEIVSIGQFANGEDPTPVDPILNFCAVTLPVSLSFRQALAVADLVATDYDDLGVGS